MSTVLWQHAQAVWTEVTFSQHLNFTNRHVLNVCRLIYNQLAVLHLKFCWLPILVGPGEESGLKKLLGIHFRFFSLSTNLVLLPDQIFPCSYYLPLVLQGRLHTGQPFF